jgi:Spy/CpxP family protein refolding chaperone
MRRHISMLAIFALTMLLTAGLTGAEETKAGQKSMTAAVVGCEKTCAAEKICANADQMTSVDAGPGIGGEGCHGSGAGHTEKGCAGFESCHGSSGCRAMMAGWSGHGMAGMHQGMMNRSDRAGRHHGRRMGPGGPRPGGPGHFIRMAEELELTEKQVEDLKALRWDHEKAAIEMRAQIETAHVDLKQLLDQETPNFGKIKATVSQIADMHKKMQLARWTLMEKSHGLLTAEQLEKAKTFHHRRSGMMKGRRQMIKKMIIEEEEK